MKGILLIAILFQSQICFSQHTTDNWFFGVLAGMHFTASGPVAQGGMINSNEGTAAVSDTNGNLLFYTDGNTIWNHLHQVMPNGTGLMGGSSSTQAALIVPKPEDFGSYYIFTTAEIGDSTGFRWSMVSMALDSGRGDLLTKNNPLLDSVTEKLCAIYNDYSGQWNVAVHKWGDDAYYIYGVGPFGISPPIISHTGIVHTTSQIQNTYGQMKFSPCGNKIAAAIGYLDTVDVSDFDQTTGSISNTISIPVGEHVYGVEFSPDGTKLYVSCYGQITVKQYDLSLGNSPAIIASATGLTITPDIYALQLGPDQKIYVAKSFNMYLDCIDSPNVAGPNCAYTNNAVNLDPTLVGITSSLGLPNFPITEIFNSTCLTSNVNDVEHESALTYPNPFTSILNIKTNEKGEAKIYDITGKIIYQKTFDAELTIDLNNHPSGIYLLEIISEQSHKTIRIIKT